MCIHKCAILTPHHIQIDTYTSDHFCVDFVPVIVRKVIKIVHPDLAFSSPGTGMVVVSMLSHESTDLGFNPRVRNPDSLSRCS